MKIPPFNYDNINDVHKEAAIEISKVLEELNQPMLGHLIKQKFKVVEIPKYDIATNKFLMACDAYGIFTSNQGYMIDNNVQYPIISVQTDVRNLELLYEGIKSGEV
jgi:hypothetical protein